MYNSLTQNVLLKTRNMLITKNVIFLKTTEHLRLCLPSVDGRNDIKTSLLPTVVSDIFL